MRAKSGDVPAKPVSTPDQERESHGREAPGKAAERSGAREPGRKKRRRSGARLPGDKGGAAVEKRPYRPRKPHFPLTPERVVEKCREAGLPVECAGEVLALMELMEAAQCIMQHLCDISGVPYATIHDLLTLDSVFNTPLRVQLATALGSNAFEFELLAYFTLAGLGLLRLG